jgi:pilus assembly protein CpaB
VSKRKILGVIGALLLATIGTVALVAYVRDARDRAVAGEELVPVFRITRQVPAGTTAEDIGGFITADTIPEKVRPDDALVPPAEGDDTTDPYGAVEGLVTAVDLVPGEVLLASRFVSPQTFERERNRVVDIPPELQEVTLSLTPERAAGGTVLPGDTVGVFASFDPFQISSVEPVLVDCFLIPNGGETPNSTHLILHKALVTKVQLEELPTVEENQDDEEVTLAPKQNLLVTIAVDTRGAERVVFAAEHGFVWMSNEPLTASEEPSQVETRISIYNDEVSDPPCLSSAVLELLDGASPGAGLGEGDVSGDAQAAGDEEGEGE